MLARLPSTLLALPSVLDQSSGQWHLWSTVAAPLHGIRCRVRNQLSGTPKFFCCTGKFVIVVIIAEAFTIQVKTTNSAETQLIRRYRGHLILEALFYFIFISYTLRVEALQREVGNKKYKGKKNT